jgi:hypothetical protein
MFYKNVAIIATFLLFSCSTKSQPLDLKQTKEIEESIECELKIPFHNVKVVVTIPSNHIINNGLQVIETSDPINNVYKNIIKITTYDYAAYYYGNDTSEPNTLRFEVCTNEKKIDIKEREFFRQDHMSNSAEKTTISLLPSNTYSYTK